MQLNNSFLNKFNNIKILYIALFYLFVIPFSLGIDNQGVSGNYLFIFFPIIAFFIKREMACPPKSIIIFMVMLSLIFLFGSISQVEQYDLFFRRSASFIVFMTIFTFMFVRIDSDMIQSFKFAIVLWSLFESSFAILEYISLDGNNTGIYGKGIFGSQRIGFVYLVGFWSIIMFKAQTNALRVVKFLAAYIVIVGLFLTYTRASILGFSVSTAAYFIYLVITSFKNSLPITASMFKIFSKAFYIIMLLVFVAAFFIGPVKYYSSAIFTYIFSTHDEYVKDDELNLYTSWTIYFENNIQSEQTSQSRMQDTIDTSRQEEFMDFIIARVANSKENGLAQQDLNKAKVELTRIMNIQNNMQAQVAKALQEKYKAEKSNNSNDIANKNEIYQGYIEQEEIIYQKLVDQQIKVDKTEIQKNLTLNRLLTIELQLLVVDIKKQLKIAKDQESINKIKQKIYYIESQILILGDKSLSLSVESSKENAVKLRMNDKGTSIGYRVFMHKKVFDQTYQNPLTGSAFLGVWTLFENREGSAHSQYLDILFRVGVIAFIVYLLFLFKVTLFLYKKDIGLFFGFIGFLFFGMFHETIKLSQGGFIFAFLFAMWSQRQYLLKDNEK